MQTNFPRDPEHLRPILDEFYNLFNEGRPISQMPSIKVLASWKKGARDFYEECLFQKVPESEYAACLRWCVEDYRRTAEKHGWNMRNPANPGSLVNWICQYESEEQSRSKYRDALKKYGVDDNNDLPYPYEA